MWLTWRTRAHLSGLQLPAPAPLDDPAAVSATDANAAAMAAMAPGRSIARVFSALTRSCFFSVAVIAAGR
jgi:hypothetical protein